MLNGKIVEWKESVVQLKLVLLLKRLILKQVLAEKAVSARPVRNNLNLDYHEIKALLFRGAFFMLALFRQTFDTARLDRSFAAR